MKSTKLTGLLAVLALAGLTAWGAHAGGVFSHAAMNGCSDGSAAQASVCPAMMQSGSSAVEFVPVCGGEAKGAQANAGCGSKETMQQTGAGAGCGDHGSASVKTAGSSCCASGKGASMQADAGGCPFMGAMGVCGTEGENCNMSPADCEKMLRSYYAEHGWLGVEMACAAGGACQPTVTAVVAGSPAAKAGFQVGDLLTSLNGVAFTAENKEAVAKLMHEGYKSGDKVRYTATRDGKTVDLQAKLAKLDDARLAELISTHVGHAHQASEKPAKTTQKAESVRS